MNINKLYSTTKFLIKEKPILKQSQKYTIKSKLFLPKNINRLGEGGLRIKGYFKRSSKDKPLMSIITVVYNGENYLEQTIKSVLEQTYDNIEYIIIDGKSNDNTIPIIKKYNNCIDYWISEPDNGIYDAMNKGISLSTGKYLGFLNADDWYLKNTIELVVKSAIETNSGYIFGNMDLYDKDKLIGHHKANLSRYKIRTPIGHQALFVQSKYLKQMPFNIKHPILADYNFMIKLINLKISYYQYDRTLVNFRVGGISSSRNISKHRFWVHYENFGFIRAAFDYILRIDNKYLSFILLGLLDLKNYIKKRY